MFQKLEGFSKKVSDLDDKPTMGAAELKAYFDSSPEEVRKALNKLITDLAATEDSNSGADHIGVTAFSGSPATVQATLEWLREQIRNVVLGSIPDNSITKTKLDASVVADLEKAASLTGRNDGTKPLKVEVRTSDPASPEIGHIWLRSDL